MNTVQSSVFLKRPQVLLLDDVEIKLLHIKDPKTSDFSRRKKQCDLWEYVWGSSLLLSAFLSCLDLTDIRTLEVGGGHGLCSIVAALRGSQVCMTDLVLDATELCKKSAELNGIRSDQTSSLEFKKLDWNDLGSVPEGKFDLVLGADVLFFRGCVVPVAKTIEKALCPGGTALIADPCRLNEEDFTETLAELGLNPKLYVFRQDFVDSFKEAGEKEKIDDFVRSRKAKLVVINKPSSFPNETSTFSKSVEQILKHFVEVEP